jgi:hypothetical protein
MFADELDKTTLQLLCPLEKQNLLKQKMGEAQRFIRENPRKQRLRGISAP